MPQAVSLKVVQQIIAELSDDKSTLRHDTERCESPGPRQAAGRLLPAKSRRATGLTQTGIFVGPRLGSFAVSADELLLADWHAPDTMYVWDLTRLDPTVRWKSTLRAGQDTCSDSESDRSAEELLAAPRSTFLFAVSDRGTVWRWDANLGAPLHRFPVLCDLRRRVLLIMMGIDVRVGRRGFRARTRHRQSHITVPSRRSLSLL
ncbi:hypothetical protein C8Q80DRAFT_523703 [Daedaleopsis nitida]|nr:hypothetical protein C8Q80DRAFT_523703 [Daedaleopsis nitida]